MEVLMAKLTKTIIDGSDPKQKDYIVWDGEVKGFGCRIWPSGKKTYVFFYRNPETNKASYLTIGVHGNITVDTARENARAWHGDLARRVDPKEQMKKGKIKDQQSITFEEFFEVFRQKYILEKHKPTTIYKDKNRINRYILPFFGKKKIGNITQEDIVHFADSLQHIKGNCTKCLRLLSVAFNQAELWGYREKNSNPCKGVPTQKEKMMENYLKDEDLERLESILAERSHVGIASPYTLAAFRLIIYTGCRLSEVLTLKWEEVDLKNSCLRLKDSKTGKRVIPLNEIAKKIIFNL
jgi:hypothetical protein